MTFFTLLHVRYHAGVTTDEMLTIPKLPFIVIGFLEAISTVSGMYAGAMLLGPAIPLLYQTFLVWQLLFSSVLLRRRYSVNQLLGCFLVVAGVIVAVTRYVMTFFTLLHVRYHAGVTTDEMLTMPKLPFIVIGFLEAISTVSGMYAGAMLPGPAIPLLYQTFLVWQLLFSSLLLRRRYSVNQLLGCFLVVAGVVVAVTSGASNSRMLSGLGILWPALMIASSAFQAAASIVKECVFLDAAARLKGKSLDIFVVNSFASGFQVIFILFFLPILSNSKGILLSELPLYFRSGVACFLNLGTNTIGCDGAPLLPLLYIASNILFNISILNLLKVSNAVVASLAARSSVPIAMYVLSLPLPYIAKEMRLSPFFHLGTFLLVVGLILYNIPALTLKTSNFN